MHLPRIRQLLYNRFGFKAEGFIVGFYEDYLHSQSRASMNAFRLRLRRWTLTLFGIPSRVDSCRRRRKFGGLFGRSRRWPYWDASTGWSQSQWQYSLLALSTIHYILSTHYSRVTRECFVNFERLRPCVDIKYIWITMYQSSIAHENFQIFWCQ